MRDPRKDKDGHISRLLSRQYKVYKNEDPTEKRQKNPPLSVLKQVTKVTTSEEQKNIGQLTVGTLFFAVRSCEYLKSPNHEKKQTKILCIRNIRFYKNGRELQHNNTHLALAYYVSITLEWQKNNLRDDEVHLPRLGHPLL